MRFYKQQHKYYCGIDLHARKMYVCIIDAKNKVKVHQNIKTHPEVLFDLIFPYIDDIGRRARMCLLLVLAGRSVCRAPHPLCPWSCIIHESHPWRQNKKRSHRRLQTGQPAQRRHLSHRIRLSGQMARHPRSAAPAHVHLKQMRWVGRTHRQHQHSV